jgi:hypothetical protein
VLYRAWSLIRRCWGPDDRSRIAASGSGIPFATGSVYRIGTMSRSYKIALILKSKSSLPVYKDLAKLSDRELDEHVSAMIRRMRTNESAVIARMVLRQPTFSLN